MDIDRMALERAKNVLQSRFDAEAYIVMALAEMRLPADRVAESHIDENIDSMADQFVTYMGVKKAFKTGKVTKEQLLHALEDFLAYMAKITAELYNSCDCPEEKQAIKEKMQKIVSNM